MHGRSMACPAGRERGAAPPPAAQPGPGWARRAAALALACAALPALAETGSALPQAVQAPHHGSTLFHFFQGQDFEALGALMTSQHFQRLAPHDDEAELLRGGLLLSYGLHHEAGQVFDRLLEGQAAPAVRDRAWYHLALIRQQRGLPQEAEAALARITAPLPPALETPRQLLAAQLLMARGAYDQAAQQLQRLAGTLPAGVPDSALAVAQFNLGVALVRAADTAGDAAGQAEPQAGAAAVSPAKAAAEAQPPTALRAQGLALLDTLGRQPAADEEQRSLRDRANLALGLAALQAGQPGRAQAVLQRVRLDSLHAPAALLGLGWALLEQGQPQQALAPWTALAERAQAAQQAGAGPSTAMLEARVALPQALADAGAWGPALARYEQALESSAQDHDSLQAGIAQLHTGAPLQALLAHQADTGIGWFARLDELPAAAQWPHAAALAPVLAGHEFQEGFKNWRDLHHLGRHLADWRSRLAAFDDMLATRDQAWAERLPPVLQGQAASPLPALQARYQALAETLQAAEAQGQVQALADTREQALQQRLTRVQASLQRLQALTETGEATQADTQAQATPQAISQAHERLRRAAGALHWQQAQQFPARLWAAKKALQHSQQALVQAQAREDALLQAQRSEPARRQALAARIAALSQRLQALVPQLQAAADDQQSALQAQAVAALQAQQAQLALYRSQALLGRAQLLDRMHLAQRSAMPQAPGVGR